MSENTQNYSLVPYQINETETIQVKQIGEKTYYSQNDMAKIYNLDKSRISRHIQEILKDGELNEKEVVAFFAITANDGKQYNVAHYTHDMTFLVGCKARSQEAQHFRKWVWENLKKYLQQKLESKYNNYQPVQNVSNFEMFNFLAGFIPLPIRIISQITQVKSGTLKDWCSKGKVNARKVLYAGVGGNFHWEIFISSLNSDMQKKVFEYFDTQNKLKPFADLYQAVLSGDSEAISKAKMLLSNNLIAA